MTTTKIENVESITANLFSNILRDHWIKQNSNDNNNDNDSGISNKNDNNNVAVVTVPKINSISLKKVDHGVLSDVYRVYLDYDEYEYNNKSNKADDDADNDDATTIKLIKIPATNWLVKLCRPDLDLSWMCQNETTFYNHVVPSIITSSIADTAHSTSLPFAFPKFLCGSDQYLILQEVSDVITYPLMDGCPSDKINFLLRCMAGMHATFWGKSKIISCSFLNSNNNNNNNNNVSLVTTAGMGQRLPPLQKEGLFISSWQETIDYMRLQNELDTDLIDFITNLSQKLSTLKLRDIHDMVHRHRVTCVHGDYHIANWLFPTNNDQQRKPVLIDFATTGFDNPMIDLVFFLVVSTNDKVVSNSPLFLEKYYKLLIEYDPNLASTINLTTLQDWFPWALLCQYMILVAYDRMCRQIAEMEQDETKRKSQIRHFCNVNRRMILAMNSIDNWDAILSKGLKPTTIEERQEARLFCEQTPLVI